MTDKIKNITEDLVNIDLAKNKDYLNELLKEINKEGLSDLIIIDLLFKIRKLNKELDIEIDIVEELLEVEIKSNKLIEENELLKKENNELWKIGGNND